MSTSPISIREQLAGLSPAKRALIEMKLLKKKAAAIEPDDRITRRPDGVPVPLSFYQQGLWVLSQLMPDTPLYHVPKAVRFNGKLDVPALQQAVDQIYRRHEALRTHFVVSDGVPFQVIEEFRSLDMPIVDLTHLDETGRETEVNRRLGHEGRRLFDLSKGPLIRAALFRLQDDEHILLLTMHHIVTDGWSVSLLQRELMSLYEAFSSGKPSPLPDLPIQYADYAFWQRQWFQGDVYQSQMNYWKQRFETLPPVLELPTDHQRPLSQAHRAFRGTKRKLTLSRKLTNQIKSLCQKEEATLFMVLLAAYQLLLHRYTGEEDIVVGSPIAGRCMEETENLIGLFVNALALRTDLSGNPTFHELLARVKEVALGGYAHQDMPFEMLVKELQPDRSLARNPLFQVMFVLQSDPMSATELDGLKISHVQVENIVANFDLTLDAVERDGQLECQFESNADLFDGDTIDRLLGHFENLLGSIVANPHQRLSAFPLLSESERHQLLVEWNDNKSDYPADKCVHQLFEEQVEESPDAVAVMFGEGQLTYGELNLRANRLARYLTGKGVGSETRVGICVERSPEMIVGLLAILKAGGAYVPLDSTYPQARLEFMIRDAGVSLLLTQTSVDKEMGRHSAEVVYLDEIAKTLSDEDGTNLGTESNANSLAYVMYTSGSTGKPKGAAVAHRSIVRLVKNTNYASFSRDEVFLQFATISFDASTFEIWGSLLNGARLALMPAGPASLDELGRALKRYKVTTLWLTAGLFHLMVDTHLDDLKGLRQLLAGGDVLSVPHVRKVLQELKGCRLINGYGPTENTTFTCCFPVTSAGVNGSVPIGRAIANTSVYVLDRHLNPSPVGIPGQLYVGGDGLARGYLNRPDLTAESFISNPFSTEAGAQLYKTGDLVRYRASGEIEFLGRLDGQVKVRGYRIELAEIETALAEHESVREAVVIARQDSGDKHLAAYVTSRGTNAANADELRAFLGERLPAHMVPSIFISVEEFPLTASGKVDRSALSAISAAKPDLQQHSAPQDQLERKLQRLWEKLLAISPIGIDDNFFALGGHSLLAVRLFAQIEKSFGKNLPLATLFQAPTIRLLAEVLRKEGWAAPWSSLVTLQNRGNRRPFFCVHAAGGNVLEYHALAQLVGPDQPFYGFQAQGLDGIQPPHTTIKDMATHYIKEMREVQPEGPYLLGGRSSGGTVAFEMACQLAAVGEQVGLLALLDSYPAGYFKLLPDSGTFAQRWQRFSAKINSHRANVKQLSGGGAKLSYLVGKLRYAPAKTKHKVYRRAYKIFQRIGRPLPSVLKNIEEINFAAVKDYLPQVYPGRATLFLASDDLTAAHDVEAGWEGLAAGGIEKVSISGNHLDIVKEPHVRTLSEKLRIALDRAQ